jgi:hypothetical protein
VDNIMKLRSLAQLVFLGFVGLFGLGCASYVPFTQELRNEHRLSSNDLKNLQFYNSHTITLRRELTKDSRQVTGSHKLLTIAGKLIEEVVIEEHTPGVILNADGGRLRVSFEEGTSVEFAVRGGESLDQPVVLETARFAEAPDAFPGNRPDSPVVQTPFFVGSGNYWLLPNGESSIDFQGQIYQAVEDSLKAHLVISSESLEETEEQKTILRGRKLN